MKLHFWQVAMENKSLGKNQIFRSSRREEARINFGFQFEPRYRGCYQ